MTEAREQRCPTHELKTWPEPFQAVLDGRKRHEIRKNDRNFKVGDGLLLKEWLPVEQKYSGRELSTVITFISSGESLGLLRETVVLSISASSPAQPTGQTPLVNPDLLAEHWLCNQSLKVDIAFCACGWAGSSQPSVGMAAKEWARHVLLTLAGAAATGETPQPNEHGVRQIHEIPQACAWRAWQCVKCWNIWITRNQRAITCPRCEAGETRQPAGSEIHQPTPEQIYHLIRRMPRDQFSKPKVLEMLRRWINVG